MHLLINKFNRILYDDNSSFSEYTFAMREWNTDTMLCPLVPLEDYVYIGAPHTFAARFLKIETANDQDGILSAEYYAGETDGWKAVKNFRDETRVGAKSLAQDGFIEWDLPDDWVKNQVNSLPELPDGVASGDGNGLYWLRLKSSAELNSATAIDWLGLIWTHERMLLTRWSECTNSKYLPTGQTHWYKEIEMSTKDVADDLKIQELIDYEMQVKDFDEISDLTTLKTLINILYPMRSSPDLNALRKDFEELYTNKIRTKIKGIDHNKDEKLSTQEQTSAIVSRIKRY